MEWLKNNIFGLLSVLCGIVAFPLIYVFNGWVSLILWLLGFLFFFVQWKKKTNWLTVLALVINLLGLLVVMAFMTYAASL